MKLWNSFDNEHFYAYLQSLKVCVHTIRHFYAPHYLSMQATMQCILVVPWFNGVSHGLLLIYIKLRSRLLHANKDHPAGVAVKLTIVLFECIRESYLHTDWNRTGHQLSHPNYLHINKYCTSSYPHFKDPFHLLTSFFFFYIFFCPFLHLYDGDRVEGG